MSVYSVGNDYAPRRRGNKPQAIPRRAPRPWRLWLDHAFEVVVFTVLMGSCVSLLWVPLP